MSFKKYVANIIVLGLYLLISFTVRQAEAESRPPGSEITQAVEDEAAIPLTQVAYDSADVSVGNNPVAVAVNPETNYVYIANKNDNTVTVLNGADQSTTTVSVGISPRVVAVNPVTNKIYVANEGFVERGVSLGSITIINGDDNSTTTVGGGSRPWDIAVNPRTNKIYVTDIHNDRVIIIDGKNNNVNTVSVGVDPVDLAINQLTNRVYVANFGDGGLDIGSLSIIDGTTDTVVATRFPGFSPQAVVVNPFSNKVYVANVNGNNVAVINGADNSLITTLNVGTYPSAAAINTQTDKIYIGNDGSDSVTVIDGATDTVETTISASTGYPMQIAVNETTNQIFVTDSYRYVTLIDGNDNSTTPIETGGEPLEVAVNPLTDIAYVTNPDRDNVTVISTMEQGSTDVGVIPGPDGCQNGLETITITMDDEDSDNKNGHNGWIGAITQDRNTNFVFCRVNGAQFKHWAANNDSFPVGAYGYAVLKLGDTCPNGSKNFSHYFDNEDKNNKNGHAGNIYPNHQDKNTTLEFCFFDGRIGLSDDSMAQFPAYRFEYGVFAHSNFLGALETGSLHTDDEDSDNKNSFGFSPNITNDERIAIHTIISDGDNTDIGLAKVHEVSPDSNFSLCPETGFCRLNPRPIDVSISISETVDSTKMLTYTGAISFFADSIYEMSNGVHKIREVRVYQNKDQVYSAHVYWQDGGRAFADLNGYNVGGRVHLFNRSPVTTTLYSSTRLGYTLGHEWGHYYYGLKDEYREFDDPASDNCKNRQNNPARAHCDDESVVPSVMHRQTNAIGGNYDWLNFSSGGAITFTHKNTQYRTYQANGWETIARPRNADPYVKTIEYHEGREVCYLNIYCDETFSDDRSRPTRGGDRRYYPELTDVAPSGTNLPNRELDELNGIDQARSLLDIQWMPSNPGKVNLNLDGGTDTSQQSPINIPVHIDPTLDKVKIDIGYDGETEKGVDLILRKPDGQIDQIVNCPATGGKETTCSIEKNDPVPGDWQVEIIVSNPPLAFDYKIIGTSPTEAALSYQATIGTPLGNVIPYPEPVTLIASVKKDLPITKVGIETQAETPDGQIIILDLADDGVSPDAVANDGKYTGFLPYTQGGDYRVNVKFDNETGTAEFTGLGVEDGDAAPYAVGENFQRSASTIITVVDYAADDHGNTPGDATPLDPDNSDQPGQIDSEGDVDIFKVVPTQTGKLAIRISGLAFEMEPKVRILAEDGTTLIEKLRYDPAQVEYLYTILDVVKDRPFYIEISHLSPDAEIGLFYLSVGPPLGEEEPNAVGPAPDQEIYLPIIVK